MMESIQIHDCLMRAHLRKCVPCSRVDQDSARLRMQLESLRAQEFQLSESELVVALSWSCRAGWP